MITFLKKKPRLNELLEGNFVDIHSHFLPGVDDGAETIADTINLCKAFENLGISQWITTPHISHYLWKTTAADLLSVYNKTKTELESNSIQAPTRVAAEYFMDDALQKLLQEGPLLTLKDKYVLVEMSYINPPIQLYDIIFDLKVAGYTPVLAHPERYLFYHKSPQDYLKLKKSGCLFQLNLLATVGYYGKEVTQQAELLLQKGMYDFAGTDVHHLRHIEALSDRIQIKSIEALKTIIAQNQFFKL